MSKKSKKPPFVSKEISWLYFNERVLQEAADPTVPLMERVKFMGIFSSNQDEFFRVRVATLQRLLKIRKKAVELIGQDPQKILDEIYGIVLNQTERFEALLDEWSGQIAADGVFVRKETELNEEQKHFVSDYFQRSVRPFLVPLMLTPKTVPKMKDHSFYL
ncbi:MAG: polyphosphate kinase 1, partial [Verrucomicrobiota bacterium]|nr:polyphosphate kinase 1 [Verrucomicrobiota bacterium]